MPQQNPANCDYLAIVSEWSSTTARGGEVGNAYPILNLTTNEIVTNPLEDFANAGAVFLMSRGPLHSWDFIHVRPRWNDRYRNANERDCCYVPARPPEVITHPPQLEKVAVILDHATFDPNSNTRQILNPRFNVTPYFFVLKNGIFYGPLVRTLSVLTAMDEIQRIDWRPAADDGIIYEVTLEEMRDQGIRIIEYTHPMPTLNRVLEEPVRLALGNVRKVISTRPRDAMPTASLIEWYLQRCPPVEISHQLLQALKSSFRAEAHDDPAIRGARLEKIEREMATNMAFLEHRERFARQYIESEGGQKRIAELIEQAVAKKASEIQAEADRQQSHLAARRDDLARQQAQLERDHQKQVDELQAEREALQNEIKDLTSAREQLSNTLATDARQLADKVSKQLPLFAALAASRHNNSVGQVQLVASNDAAPAQPRRLEFRPVLMSVSPAVIDNETKLVDRIHANLARHGLHFVRDFVANVYTCLKAEALNLIIGPPGHGKSMLVTMLARILGHGNSMLRIPVRRTWSEDRYLLGSFDSFHNRYDPGPTGLVPRMLQAEADWAKDKVGIYIVLLDEFNLAAPEYYFSQLMQALPSDDPVREVVLYDSASVGGDGFPDKVKLCPNLRFWGTINYDETTERLSPRALDRTGMIFLGEADVKATLDDDAPKMPGVLAKDLFGKYTRTADECPEEHWSIISKVIDLLRSSDADLGPRVELSPRVRRAIKRYLANSAAVMSPNAAADFAVQQRILPVIRGRGDAFLARINRLVALLGESNLPRSAQHVEEALRRSEQQFGDLDMLSY